MHSERRSSTGVARSTWRSRPAPRRCADLLEPTRPSGGSQPLRCSTLRDPTRRRGVGSRPTPDDSSSMPAIARGTDILFGAIAHAERRGDWLAASRAAVAVCRLGPTSHSGTRHDEAAQTCRRLLGRLEDPGGAGLARRRCDDGPQHERRDRARARAVRAGSGGRRDRRPGRHVGGRPAVGLPVAGGAG